MEAGEWYMVKDEIWRQAWGHISRSAPGRQILCIGCLEKRIGRRLTPRDFTDASVNDSTSGQFRIGPHVRPACVPDRIGVVLNNEKGAPP
jgi:hypothetical protein